MERSEYDILRDQQTTHWWFVGKKDIVLDFAEHHGGFHKCSDMTVLDVGCGMGLMLQALSEYGHAFGMDMSPYAVEYCKQQSDVYHFDADVRCGRLPDEIPFDTCFFDYIFALDVIEHVEDDETALRTLCSMLKPGGKLMMTVPALMSLWSYHDVVNHHFRRYSKHELLQKLEAAGFVVDRWSFYNSYLVGVIWLVRKLKTALRFNMSDVNMNHAGRLNDLLTKIFVSEKYWLRHHRFMFGASLIALCEKRV